MNYANQVAAEVPAFDRPAGQSSDQTHAAPSAVPSPRKIWPCRDDGIHVVAQQNGAKIGVRGSAVVVSDQEGRKLHEVPLANVESLSLLGSVQISTQAIQTLAERGIPVAFLSAFGRLTAMMEPRGRKAWNRLNWFLTTSARLQPQGPWLDYVEAGLPAGIAYKKGESGFYLD